MTNERQLFNQLLDCDSDAARRALLEELAGNDPALRDRLAGLLAAHGDAGDFLKGESSHPNQPATVSGHGSVPVAEGPGSVIGRYKLLQKIGEGGFGVVYMAEQREPVKRRVALKIIKLGMDTRQVVGRFEAERQALAMMDHPNIAKVLDGGATETGRPYFVMELVKGVPITEFCDENNLGTVERLKLFIQVCEALHHAHQKGILHRDIKPGNVMVTLHDDRPVPKVIDFGIAKATQQELTEITIFTRYQELIGTPAYMSPEQAQFSGLDIDTRTDIYSLGVLLYELLTGGTPFDGRELVTAGYDEMRRRIREEEPLKPSTRVKTLAGAARKAIAQARGEDADRLDSLLRGELDWIVMKALEKDRTRRYESAAAFARDVERFLADEPVTAAAPSVAYRFRKFTARHRTMMLAGSAILLLLVAGIVTTSYQAVRAARAELLAVQHLNREYRQRVALELVQEQRNTALGRLNREAAISAAVVRFLNEDIFSGATLELSNDRELTVRSLIARARNQLGETFQNQPDVEAAIRHTIASTLLTLGESQAAAEEARRALDLRSEHLGENAKETLESLILLARTRQARDQVPEARALLEAALKRAREHFGPTNLITIGASYRLAGLIQYDPQQRERTRELIEHAVAVGREHPDIEPRDFMAMLQIRGRVVARDQGPAAGEELYREAIAYGTSRLGENHPWTSNARGNLAGFLCDWNRNLPAAEALSRRAVARSIQVFGESHPTSLNFRMTLTLILWKQSRWAEALREELKGLQLRLEPGASLGPLQVFLSHAPLSRWDKDEQHGHFAWSHRSLPPSLVWEEPGASDAEWQQGPTVTGETAWWRGVLELKDTSGFTPVLLVRGGGEFEVSVNGTPAGLRPPHADANLQVLVFSDAACAALRPGRNIIAVSGRNLPDEPFPVLELYRGPDLREDRNAKARGYE